MRRLSGENNAEWTLRYYGWTRTRAGRWVDPRDGGSYLAVEAWVILLARLRAESSHAVMRL